MKISLLSGGKDPHYVLGLFSGLTANDVHVELVGNMEMKELGPSETPFSKYYLFHKESQEGGSIILKIALIFQTYIKLLFYTITTDTRIFHIQWENKFTFFDWTFLNLYYKLLGKKLIFTAHNVNVGDRDKNNTFIKQFALAFVYRIVDHVIVHTQKMKAQLVQSFHISESKVSIIPFGVNTVVPNTDMTRAQARKAIDLKNEKVLLFFGNIAPYKGLEYLIWALPYLVRKEPNYKLIIAGRVKKGCDQYWKELQGQIRQLGLSRYIITKIEFIPDEDIEIYCKSADVMVLPYKSIFQSGILFLSYSFGLPVVASDVGSLKEHVIEGETGYICVPKNTKDLAKKISDFFNSKLYANQGLYRQKIIDHARNQYSWENIGKQTKNVYRLVQLGR